MRTNCSRCQAEIQWTPTGRNRGRTTFSHHLIATCIVIRERLAEKGSTSNYDCPHMDAALAALISQYRRRA